MASELVYLLEVNAGLVLFYVFYRLFCVSDTFFVWKRFVLLSFVAASFLLPLADVKWPAPGIVSSPVADYMSAFVLPEAVAEASAPSDSAPFPPVVSALVLLYVAGLCLLALRMIVRLGSVCRLLRLSSPGSLHGVNVRFLSEPSGPFSFFGWIFVCRRDVEASDEEEVLAHERAHVRQWHSLDVLLMEAVTAVCWWNPFAWLLRREVCENLEYLADRSVLESGFPVRKYQYHLVELASRPSGTGITNHFNLSYLKKRIIMMNKKKTSRAGYFKYALLAFPAFALLMLGNMSCTSEKKQADESVTEQTAPASEPVQAPADTPAPAETEEEVYTVVEQMPEFPGGVQKLLDFISQNIQYPQTAMKQNVQGRAIVQFVIEKDGSLSNFNVLRSVHPDLDAEAVRVVKSMPKWKPGMQKGEPVRCKYTLPVMFKLQ